MHFDTPCRRYASVDQTSMQNIGNVSSQRLAGDVGIVRFLPFQIVCRKIGKENGAHKKYGRLYFNLTMTCMKTIDSMLLWSFLGRREFAICTCTGTFHIIAS
jgi:hypothetical protein